MADDERKEQKWCWNLQLKCSPGCIAYSNDPKQATTCRIINCMMSIASEKKKER
jgi:hypothetical protein